jgi:hypothetical protein
MIVFDGMLSLIFVIFLFFNRFASIKRIKMMYFCVIFPKNYSGSNFYIA